MPKGMKKMKTFVVPYERKGKWVVQAKDKKDAIELALRGMGVNAAFSQVKVGRVTQFKKGDKPLI